ncbi:MAG TPA: ROK family protein, partial [Candidatus Limnocylindrales bacterium]|nr:ROK family protein [Candidatus Limnocylindrales bacterium]
MSGANERLGIGIDVGGSSIKAGLADLASGRLVGDRLSVPTPRPAAPRSVVEAIVGLVRELDAVRPGAEPVGVGVPCVVVRGVTRTAANIDPAWIGFPAARGLSEAVGRPVTVVNDADAAGVAEMRFGAGRGRDGVVILLTLGTGVGSAIFTDGRLVPNSELGHLPLHGDSAEKRTAAVVWVREKLSWEEYAARLTEHLTLIE